MMWYLTIMKNIHSCDEYTISIAAWCSTADNLPDGVMSCRCFQQRMKKSDEAKREHLKRRWVSFCGKYPTNIIIERVWDRSISQERWNTHKETITHIIQHMLDEMHIGKDHEIHYKKRSNTQEDVIGIQLYRNFDSLKDDIHSWNTMPEK